MKKKKLKKEIAELKKEIRALQKKAKKLEELNTKIQIMQIDIDELKNPLFSNPAVKTILLSK